MRWDCKNIRLGRKDKDYKVTVEFVTRPEFYGNTVPAGAVSIYTIFFPDSYHMNYWYKMGITVQYCQNIACDIDLWPKKKKNSNQ